MKDSRRGKTRNFWIFPTVTLAHVGVLSWFMVAEFPEPLAGPTTPFHVEIIELSSISPAVSEPAITAPARIIRAEPAPVLSEPPLVRETQQMMIERSTNAPVPAMPGLTDTTAPNAENSDAGDHKVERDGRAQLADVLQRLQCEKLQRPQPDACPKADPFAVAQAVRKRSATYTEQTRSQDGDPETQVSRLYMMPGMDSDLFVEGFAPGAYNAHRIRNGQSPIWDKSIEAGLRQSD